MISVLVADDHVWVRRSVTGLLQCAADISVVTECEDGDQVLEAVQRHHPDIAVLDVRMARTSGIEAAREVRRCTDTRVIILTGSWSEQLVEEAREAGASGFVLKGDDPALLPDLVRRVARGGTAWGGRGVGARAPRTG